LRNLERIADHGGGPPRGALTINVSSGADVHDGMTEAMLHLRKTRRGGGFRR
jgi:hypothetical protein